MRLARALGAALLAMALTVAAGALLLVAPFVLVLLAVGALVFWSVWSGSQG